MTEQIAPHAGEKILEIGTGSGYQAAVLAEMGAQVFSIEIVPELAERAKTNLARLGYGNIEVRSGDGYRGWPEHAPFDKIIVTCAPDHVPKPLVEQLKEGGRMIIPVGDTYEELHLLEKQGGRVIEKSVMPVRFVPMTGEAREHNPER
jgi:protein-L-isoaspartate(D-aspartate) O-methyltransferase